MYTLTDLLNGASDHRLVQLTSRHGIAGQALTRDQMITGLGARLGNPSYLQTVIRDLPPPLQLALRRHLVHGRSLRNTADEVLGNRGAELTDALRGLGLLGSGTSVPLEVERAAIRLWAEEIAWTGQVSSAGTGPDPTGPGPLRDLFALLSMAARRGLPLTQQGELFRKAQEGPASNRSGGDLGPAVVGSDLDRYD